MQTHHAPSTPTHGQSRLQKFLLDHDPVYRENYSAADHGNPSVTRWLFNAARRRAVAAGLITQEGKPVFRNEPRIVIVQQNSGRGI